MNKVFLMGRLTRPVEEAQTSSGTLVCKTAIAVNRKVDKDATDFFEISAFGKTGEFLRKYFTKGSPITVVGECHIDKYMSKKDGQQKTRVEVAVSDIYFCVGATKQDAIENNSDVPSAYGGSQIGFTDITTDEDLPF